MLKGLWVSISSSGYIFKCSFSLILCSYHFRLSLRLPIVRQRVYFILQKNMNNDQTEVFDQYRTLKR